MKVLGAYMLAVVGGNKTPSADDVKKILGSVGAEMSADDTKQLASLIEQLAEKSYDETLKEGMELLAKCPGTGGGGGGAPAAAAAGGAGGPAAAAAEEEEEEEEEEMAAAGGLFGEEGDDY